MDAITISLLIGLATLLIERLFDWFTRISRSNCCWGAIHVHLNKENKQN